MAAPRNPYGIVPGAYDLGPAPDAPPEPTVGEVVHRRLGRGLFWTFLVMSLAFVGGLVIVEWQLALALGLSIVITVACTLYIERNSSAKTDPDRGTATPALRRASSIKGRLPANAAFVVAFFVVLVAAIQLIYVYGY